MSRKAIVNEQSGVVLNVIEIEDDANWSPPEGYMLVDASDAGSIGDIWDGEEFETPEREEDISDVRLSELIVKLKADTMSLKEVREFLRVMYGLDEDED